MVELVDGILVGDAWHLLSVDRDTDLPRMVTCGGAVPRVLLTVVVVVLVRMRQESAPDIILLI